MYVIHFIKYRFKTLSVEMDRMGEGGIERTYGSQKQRDGVELNTE